jgi:hypothetical protein
VPETQPVERHRLHQRPRRPPAPVHERSELEAVQGEFRALRHEALGLRQEDELVEPGGEERRQIQGLDHDSAFDRLSVPGACELGEGPERLFEHPFRGLRLELDLELRGVIHEAVHAFDCTAQLLRPG